jgi:hypothetical protein
VRGLVTHSDCLSLRGADACLHPVRRPACAGRPSISFAVGPARLHTERVAVLIATRVPLRRDHIDGTRNRRSRTETNYSRSSGLAALLPQGRRSRPVDLGLYAPARKIGLAVADHSLQTSNLGSYVGYRAGSVGVKEDPDAMMPIGDFREVVPLNRCFIVPERSRILKRVQVVFFGQGRMRDMIPARQSLTVTPTLANPWCKRP